MDQRQAVAASDLDDLIGRRIGYGTEPGRQASVNGPELVVGLAVALDAGHDQTSAGSQQCRRRIDRADEVTDEVQHVHRDDRSGRTHAERRREDVTLHHPSGQAVSSPVEHGPGQVHADGLMAVSGEGGTDQAGADTELDDWAWRKPWPERGRGVTAASVSAACRVVPVGDPVEGDGRRR